MLLVFFLMYRTAEAEWHGVCMYVLACVCALSLRAAVVLDLCPFGGRKCACAGRAKVGRVLRSGKEKEKKWKDKVRMEESVR